MSAEDRARALKDTSYSRNPREMREQAAFRRFVDNKISQLDEIVFWAKDYHDTNRHTPSRLFMDHYNHYHNQVAKFYTDLGGIITRNPSTTLLKHFLPFFQRLDRVVDRMVEIAENPSERSSEGSSGIPVFPAERTVTTGEVPRDHIPMLRRSYEHNFNRISQDFGSIQADPDISPRRLNAFNAEKLYFEYLRTTYSNTIENGLKDGVEGSEPVTDLIKKYTEHLEETVKEIRRLSTGPESEESEKLSDDSSDSDQ